MQLGIGIVLVFAAIVGLLIVYYRMQHAAQEREEREEQQREVFELASKAQAHLSKVETAKTTSASAKVNNCDKALGYLYDAGAYRDCREVITNYRSLVERIVAIKKVLPIVAHVERAYKHQSKGKDAAEKSALLDALYEIETNEVCNTDFNTAEVMPQGTGGECTIRSVNWSEPER